MQTSTVDQFLYSTAPGDVAARAAFVSNVRRTAHRRGLWLGLAGGAIIGALIGYGVAGQRTTGLIDAQLDRDMESETIHMVAACKAGQGDKVPIEAITSAYESHYAFDQQLDRIKAMQLALSARAALLKQFGCGNVYAVSE